MPMNEQPPWGKKKKPSTPEDFLASLIQKIRDSFSEQDQQKNQGDGNQTPQGPQDFAPGIGKIILIVLLFSVAPSLDAYGKKAVVIGEKKSDMVMIANLLGHFKLDIDSYLATNLDKDKADAVARSTLMDERIESLI